MSNKARTPFLDKAWDYLRDLLKVPPSTKTPIQLVALCMVSLLSISVVYVTSMFVSLNTPRFLEATLVFSVFFAFIASMICFTCLKAIGKILPKEGHSVTLSPVVPQDMRIQGPLYRRIEKAFKSLGFSVSRTKEYVSISGTHHKISVAQKGIAEIGIIWLDSDPLCSTVPGYVGLKVLGHIALEVLRGRLAGLLVCSDVEQFPMTVISDLMAIVKHGSKMKISLFTKQHIDFVLLRATGSEVANLLQTSFEDLARGG